MNDREVAAFAFTLRDFNIDVDIIEMGVVSYVFGIPNRAR